MEENAHKQQVKKLYQKKKKYTSYLCCVVLSKYNEKQHGKRGKRKKTRKMSDNYGADDRPAEEQK